MAKCDVGDWDGTYLCICYIANITHTDLADLNTPYILYTFKATNMDVYIEKLGAKSSLVAG
jgi:hypothetical protein